MKSARDSAVAAARVPHLWIAGLLCWSLLWSTPTVAGESAAEQLVKQLGDPSYHSRRAAADQLLELHTRRPSDDARRAEVATTLQRALQNESLEIRLAAEQILRQIAQVEFDRQLQELLDPRSDAQQIQLSGWQSFSKLAGSDIAARRLFGRLCQTHRRLIRHIETSSRSAADSESCPLDPYQLDPDDEAGWTLLLWMDLANPTAPPAALSPRISMALSNTAMGPRIIDKKNCDVTRRLIARWIDRHASLVGPREGLLVAMRYGCHAQATRLCDQVLSDPTSSPAAQVTAMLAASALRRSDLESQLQARIDDDRTSHVWQLVTASKTKIRTQVRDVAWALLLHQRGLDPREAGFAELQADPLLIFLDHSLGFPDEPTRQQSHQRAMRLLAHDQDASLENS